MLRPGTQADVYLCRHKRVARRPHQCTGNSLRMRLNCYYTSFPNRHQRLQEHECIDSRHEFYGRRAIEETINDPPIMRSRKLSKVNIKNDRIMCKSKRKINSKVIGKEKWKKLDEKVLSKEISLLLKFLRFGTNVKLTGSTYTGDYFEGVEEGNQPIRGQKKKRKLKNNNYIDFKIIKRPEKIDFVEVKEIINHLKKEYRTSCYTTKVYDFYRSNSSPTSSSQMSTETIRTSYGNEQPVDSVQMKRSSRLEFKPKTGLINGLPHQTDYHSSESYRIKDIASIAQDLGIDKEHIAATNKGLGKQNNDQSLPNLELIIRNKREKVHEREKSFNPNNDTSAQNLHRPTINVELPPFKLVQTEPIETHSKKSSLIENKPRNSLRKQKQSLKLPSTGNFSTEKNDETFIICSQCIKHSISSYSRQILPYLTKQVKQSSKDHIQINRKRHNPTIQSLCNHGSELINTSHNKHGGRCHERIKQTSVHGISPSSPSCSKQPSTKFVDLKGETLKKYNKFTNHVNKESLQHPKRTSGQTQNTKSDKADPKERCVISKQNNKKQGSELNAPLLINIYESESHIDYTKIAEKYKTLRRCFHDLFKRISVSSSSTTNPKQTSTEFILTEQKDESSVICAQCMKSYKPLVVSLTKILSPPVEKLLNKKSKPLVRTRSGRYIKGNKCTESGNRNHDR